MNKHVYGVLKYILLYDYFYFYKGRQRLFPSLPDQNDQDSTEASRTNASVAHLIAELC